MMDVIRRRDELLPQGEIKSRRKIKVRVAFGARVPGAGPSR